MLPNLRELLLSWGAIFVPLSDCLARAAGVSLPLFASLERTSRLVDIAYCVGNVGLAPPFMCPSRCADFPTVHLLQTWHTGLMLTDSCGYIAIDHGPDPAIVIAFRGTYSLTNAVVDLRFLPQAYVPYPTPKDPDFQDHDPQDDDPCANCSVHAGFLASWRDARKTVLPALRLARLMHPGYPLHLIGHSLGGAVAALAALELRLARPAWPAVRVTTFGEPRLGNTALADYIDRAFGLANPDPDADAPQGLLFRRVTHTDDPVPLLPLAEWGYRAHAGEIYIAKKALQPAPEDLRLCRGQADQACSDGEGRGGVQRRWAHVIDENNDHNDHDDHDDVDDDHDDYDDDEVAVEKVRRDQTVVPVRFKLWQMLFAHRDYFWRMGLCVPGGDPTDWRRTKYNFTLPRTGAVREDHVRPGRDQL